MVQNRLTRLSGVEVQGRKQSVTARQRLYHRSSEGGTGEGEEATAHEGSHDWWQSQPSSPPRSPPPDHPPCTATPAGQREGAQPTAVLPGTWVHRAAGLKKATPVAEKESTSARPHFTRHTTEGRGPNRRRARKAQTQTRAEGGRRSPPPFVPCVARHPERSCTVAMAVATMARL